MTSKIDLKLNSNQDRINNIQSKPDPIYEIFNKSNSIETNFYVKYTGLINRVENLPWTDPQSNLEKNNKLITLISELNVFFEETLSSEHDFIKSHAFTARLDELEQAVVYLEQIYGDKESEGAPELFSLIIRQLLEGDKNVDLLSYMIDFSSKSFQLRQKLEKLYTASEPIKELQKTEITSTVTSLKKALGFTSPNSIQVLSETKDGQISEEERAQILSFVHLLRKGESEFEEKFLNNDVAKLSSTPVATAKEILNRVEAIERKCRQKGWIIEEEDLTSTELIDGETSSESAGSTLDSEATTSSNHLDIFSKTLDKYLDLQRRMESLTLQKTPQKHDFLLSQKKDLFDLLRKENQAFGTELQTFCEKKQECSSILNAAEKMLPPETPLNLPSNNQSVELPIPQKSASKTSTENFSKEIVNRYKAAKATFSTLQSRATSLLSTTLSPIGEKMEAAKALFITPLELKIEAAKATLKEEELRLGLTNDRFLKTEIALEALNSFLDESGNVRELQRSFNMAKDLFNQPFPEIVQERDLQSIMKRKKDSLFTCNQRLISIEGGLNELEKAIGDSSCFTDPASSTEKLKHFSERSTNLAKKTNLEHSKAPARFQNLANIVNLVFDKDLEKRESLILCLNESFQYFKKWGGGFIVACNPEYLDSTFKEKEKALFESLKKILLVEKELQPAFLKLSSDLSEECVILKERANSLLITLAHLMQTNIVCSEEESFQEKALPELNQIVRKLNTIQNDYKNMQMFTTCQKDQKTIEETIQNTENTIRNFMQDNKKEIDEEDTTSKALKALSDFYQV